MITQSFSITVQSGRKVTVSKRDFNRIRKLNATLAEQTDEYWRLVQRVMEKYGPGITTTGSG